MRVTERRPTCRYAEGPVMFKVYRGPFEVQSLVSTKYAVVNDKNGMCQDRGMEGVQPWVGN